VKDFLDATSVVNLGMEEDEPYPEDLLPNDMAVGGIHQALSRVRVLVELADEELNIAREFTAALSRRGSTSSEFRATAAKLRERLDEVGELEDQFTQENGVAHAYEVFVEAWNSFCDLMDSAMCARDDDADEDEDDWQ